MIKRIVHRPFVWIVNIESSFLLSASNLQVDKVTSLWMTGKTMSPMCP